jgi:PEP-CTERM motif
MPQVSPGFFSGLLFFLRGAATRRPVGLLLVLSALLVPRPANAELITWEFTGHVTSARALIEPSNLGLLFPVDTEVTFTLSYETDLVPEYVTPGGTAMYVMRRDIAPELFTHTLTIGEHHFRYNNRGSMQLNVANGVVDGDTFSDIALTGDPVVGAPTWYPATMFFWLRAPTISGGGLPTELPDDLSNSSFLVYMQSYGPQCAGESCGANGHIGGNFTSVRRVPTPSTLTLFGLGLAGMAAWRRRSRPQSRDLR